MSEVKTIAILGGTGKEGPGLAMRWANAGYKIIIGSRQQEKAEATAAELNETLGIDSIIGLENEVAAQQADVNVLTVVQSAHQPALEGLKAELQGKILVDATARVDFRDPKPPEAPSAGRIAQDILGEGVRVVAAFQNVPASALKKNLDQPVTGTDVLVCADDVEAAEMVVKLAGDAGMRAFYGGGLDNALVVEGLTALLISMNKHYGGHSSINVSGIEK
ncbi:MAG: NADPH-dependent F420 reductase [Anaerolineales bacterium]|nr:NADPH-dependent F420 reductase [Anaerolineales bacterium]